jgi:NAD(P)H dehydrogenase (quinone)
MKVLPSHIIYEVSNISREKRAEELEINKNRLFEL